LVKIGQLLKRFRVRPDTPCPSDHNERSFASSNYLFVKVFRTVFRLRFPTSSVARKSGRKYMATFIEFAVLLLVTIVALFSALVLQALLLEGVFALMEPAAATRPVLRRSIGHGVRLAARAFARTR